MPVIKYISWRRLLSRWLGHRAFHPLRLQFSSFVVHHPHYRGHSPLPARLSLIDRLQQTLFLVGSSASKRATPECVTYLIAHELAREGNSPPPHCHQGQRDFDKFRCRRKGSIPFS